MGDIEKLLNLNLYPGHPIILLFFSLHCVFFFPLRLCVFAFNSSLKRRVVRLLDYVKGLL